MFLGLPGIVAVRGMEYRGRWIWNERVRRFSWKLFGDVEGEGIVRESAWRCYGEVFKFRRDEQWRTKYWLFRDVKYILSYRDLHKYREIQKLANHLVSPSSFFKDHTSPNRIIPLFFALSLHTIRLLLIPVQSRRRKIPCALKQYPTPLPFTLFSISSLLRSDVSSSQSPKRYSSHS